MHPPVEPIPDDDWEGETWGLYWPDIEQDMDERKEDPCKYVVKHYEKRTEARPPPDQRAERMLSIDILLCPRKTDNTFPRKFKEKRETCRFRQKKTDRISTAINVRKHNLLFFS